MSGGGFYINDDGQLRVRTSSAVSRMWNALEVILKNSGHAVVNDLLQQRYEVYLKRKEFFGEMADFKESVEMMTRLERGTGKVLRDIG